MIFDCKLEVFLGLDCSQDEAFVCLNHHQVWVLLDKYDRLALIREDIVADRAESELRFQGLAKFMKASLECKQNFPSTRFSF